MSPSVDMTFITIPAVTTKIGKKEWKEGTQRVPHRATPKRRLDN
jgi:hypothetical protein